MRVSRDAQSLRFPKCFVIRASILSHGNGFSLGFSSSGAPFSRDTHFDVIARRDYYIARYIASIAAEYLALSIIYRDFFEILYKSLSFFINLTTIFR